MNTRLGPYELLEPVGRGGTGRVWRAVHTDTGAVVAVKVVTAERARRRNVARALKAEMRAAVALEHPNVAAIYDLGVVPREAVGTGEGALVASSPYLVMEYADGGTLKERCGRVRWPEARGVLLALLDALGHAHARGLVHRDVKPANVLVAGPDLVAGIRLTDFGLARVDFDNRTDTTDPVVGTPRYMAPEQMLGHWRDQGPWTDLYALGRLSLALLMGPLDAPWVPPELPAGLGAWLARMLAPRPNDRFQLAADAALALRRLPSALEEDPARVRELISASAAEQVTRAERRVPPMAPLFPMAVAFHERPPGIGVDLLASRPPSFVARDAELAALWDALHAVRGDSRSRVVLLRGHAGSGRSRLAEHFAERANEVGVASVLAATGGPHAIARVLARQLGCVGLSGAARRDRVRDLLAAQDIRDDYEAEALSELLRPGCAPRVEEDALEETRTEERVVVRFGSPEERWALVSRALARMARVRPVIVVFDDAHADADTLALAAHLAGGANAVLFVLTIRDDDLPDDARTLVQALAARPYTTTIACASLPAVAHARLLDGLAVRDADLVQRIAERTSGNPQFTVQIVRHLVQNGSLRWIDGGFRLRRGAVVELPDDLHAAWRQRLERLLEDLPREGGWWLERAAVLGHDVDAIDWRLVCDDPRALQSGRRDVFSARGEAVRARVVDRLLAARFVAVTEDGFEFANAMVREALERRAREAGRTAAHHRACAALLAHRDGADVAERRGRHLVAAGHFEAALDPWFVAVEAMRDGGDPRAALLRLDAIEQVLKQIPVARNDRRWGRVLELRAAVLFLAGDYEAVGPVTDKLEEVALANDWPDQRVAALLLRARPLTGRGRFGEACGWLEEAVRLAEREQLPEQLGAAETALGGALSATGEAERAVALLQKACAGLREAGDLSGEAFAWKALAAAFRQQGRLAEAAFAFDRAGERLAVTGHRYAASECLNGLGDVRRLQGDLGGAEEAYRDALSGCALLGSWHVHVIQVNLALVLIAQRRYLEAYALLVDDLPEIERHGLAWLSAVTHVVCLPCTAAAGDDGAFLRHLDQAERLLAGTAFADVDLARVAELASTIWRDRREPTLADRAATLAIAQWSACGRLEEADRLAKRVR